MTRKSQVTQDLLSFIRDERLQPGQKLLPERTLSKKFNASRNTLREAIKVLENRGFLEVRASSGCYVKTTEEPAGEKTPGGKSDVPQDLAKQLEACFLFLPSMAYAAVPGITGRDIQLLEETIVDISKSIISGNLPLFIESDAKFRATIIASIGSEVLDEMNTLIQFNHSDLYQIVKRLPEEAAQQVFAGYVKALEAIRNRDQKNTKQILENNLLYMVRLLVNQPNLTFSDWMKMLLAQYKPEPTLG